VFKFGRLAQFLEQEIPFISNGTVRQEARLENIKGALNKLISENR